MRIPELPILSLIAAGLLLTALPAQEAAATAAQLGSADFRPTSEHPLGYRGDGTGRYPGASDPCREWSEHAIEAGPDVNLRWKTPLGGFTMSHPIVVGGKLITLEEPNRVVCLDAESGKLLWRRECDHLSLFTSEQQERARALLAQVADSFFLCYELFWEYRWLNGTWRYQLPGERPRAGLFGEHEASERRMHEIDATWKEHAFAATPASAGWNGHSLTPFAKDTPQYAALAKAMTDLQVDFGICAPLWGCSTQMQQFGQTQGTPACDGERIYVVFGYGQTACLDLDGNLVWMKWYPHRLDRDKVLKATLESAWLGFLRKGLTGPSPLLVDDQVIIVQGYAIRALSKATGELRWEVPYGNGMEANDGRVAFRGPAVATLADGTKVLVCPQGYLIRVGDGKVLCADRPMDMFMVPFGNVHCYVMGLVAEGDVCYFTWAAGAGAVRIVAGPGKDRASCRHLWLTEIPEAMAVQRRNHPEGIERGSVSPETCIENAPVFDPDRKRVYVSTHCWTSLWSFDAESGRLVDGVDVKKEQPALLLASHHGSYAESGSNELTDPIIVGRKYVYAQTDLGACYVYDADDLHHILAGNRLMTQVHRDIALWTKPWAEIKAETYDRNLVSGSDMFLGNDAHRAPADLFVQGSRVYIRTIEGVTCFGADAASGAGP
jgi:outer membrane protein assembly factor BamB